MNQVMLAWAPEFPPSRSMHVANATLFVLLAGNAVRVFAVLYGAVIMFASVHLGWHYAIDGHISIAAIALIWLGVGRLLR